MRRPNCVRAAKCSDRCTGLRSPVSCAKPTTSDAAMVFFSRSVMPTLRSSKNNVRSGGRLVGSVMRVVYQNVARMERSEIRGWPQRCNPDYASLHPGYDLLHLTPRPLAVHGG